MLTIKFGDREWKLDTAAPYSIGDLAAMREMGVSPNRMAELFGQLGAALGSPNKNQMLEMALLAAQVAYLAAVREDHDLRWRDFVWSIPLDDLGAFSITGGESAAETGTVGEALAAAGAAKPAARKRPSRAKNTTTT